MKNHTTVKIVLSCEQGKSIGATLFSSTLLDLWYLDLVSIVNDKQYACNENVHVL